MGMARVSCLLSLGLLENSGSRGRQPTASGHSAWSPLLLWICLLWFSDLHVTLG